MPIDFPANPTNGQYHAGYIWNDASGVWDSAYAPRAATIPISSPNVIINGAFDIWQRGTTFNNIAANTYFADRFATGPKDAGITLNVSQQSFTPGSAPVAGYEGQFFARLSNSSFTSGNSYYFGQKIEDVRTFAGQTVTLSYWAKVGSGTLTPTRVFLNQQFGSGGSAEVDNIGVATPSYTTSWQRFSQTVSIPSIAGKTIGAGSSLWVLWQITPNANVTLDIWGVQVEAGAAATEFRRNAPSIQAELAACQRYYVRIGGTSGYAFWGSGNQESTINSRIIVPLPVRLRTSPTSVVIAGANNLYIGGSNLTITAGAPAAVYYISEVVAALDISNSSGGSAGRSVTAASPPGAGNYLEFNAEL